MMREPLRPRCGWRRVGLIAAIAVGLVGVGLTASAQGTGRNGGEPSARFELPADPDQVVIRFTERFGELEADDYPTLRVYADGRVVSHRPVYMARQGDFTGRVSREELERLLGSFSENGILDFDARKVRSATRAVRRSQAIETVMTDPSAIEIEVRLAGYRRNKSAAVERDYRKLVSWTGLRYDARTYTEVPGVQSLATAYRQLTELAERAEQTGSRPGGGR